MKETIEQLAQVVGFDLAGLVTQQFKDKYEKKKYAGDMFEDYFTYDNKRTEFFKRYVSLYFKDTPRLEIKEVIIDYEWETHKWRW